MSQPWTEATFTGIPTPRLISLIYSNNDKKQTILNIHSEHTFCLILQNLLLLALPITFFCPQII